MYFNVQIVIVIKVIKAGGYLFFSIQVDIKQVSRIPNIHLFFSFLLLQWKVRKPERILRPYSHLRFGYWSQDWTEQVRVNLSGQVVNCSTPVHRALKFRMGTGYIHPGTSGSIIPIYSGIPACYQYESNFKRR